jgi:beta-xylosidase
VCRVGDEYVLATSSFTYFPGVPIFRSRNLVDWTQIGNALDRPQQLDLRRTTAYGSAGIFAPTLRHHDDRFWLVTTNYGWVGDVTVPFNFLVTATDPAGPWSDPVPVLLPGIDPDLVWSDDGACWVHFSNGKSIQRCRIDTASGEILEGPEQTWSGSGLQFPEAPHVFERDGTWYLVIAEGGTERGHAVSIARGASALGPWKPCPANPILSHRSTDLPVQNTGHADFVEAPDGTWWMVLLGTRPRGMSPMFHVLGRETFLAPVDWADGWPVVEPVGLTVPRRPPGPQEIVAGNARDDFDGDDLDPSWIAVRRSARTFSDLNEMAGWLSITGGGPLDGAMPAFVGRRQRYERCRASTLVRLRDATEAGLSMRMDERFHYDVAVNGERIIVRAQAGPIASVMAEAPKPDGDVVLFIETRDTSGTAPDDVVLGFHDAAGDPVELAVIDGRFLSTEVAGGMLGRVIGLYAIDGTAAFDWFEDGEITV